TPAQEDFYAIQGTAGQLITIQVISRNNTLNSHPIVPELELVDPSGGGQVIAYNEKEFESLDSTLLDVMLPETGTYYVGVDSLLGAGDYQLFMYSFATGSGPGSGDTLVGGNGNVTLRG